jgi:UDP-GlcNAc:undecaprenyl-phosphate GlcNAc-1-phosphate transferase
VPQTGWYLLVLVVAAAVTAALTVPAKRLSQRVGYVAQPGDRTVHGHATPYGGGAAMFMGFLAAMIVASLIPGLHPIFDGSSEPMGVVLAAAAIFAIGLIDDIRDMSAPAKVAGEVLAASILYFAGVTMYQFKVPLAGFIVLGPNLIPLLTALWVIALTNAVNLIDGLDGLAAGVVAIGGGALAVYGLRLVFTGQLPADNVGPLVATIACGVCLGFLPFNFHPARVFMGDAGALFLGLLMSAATMVIGGRTPPVSGETYFFFAPLFIPFFILGVPLVDMAFAFVRRTARGTGFHTPDKEHIHHRLLRLGHGHRRSVVILWAWTALLSGFLLFPLFDTRVNAFIPFGALALGVALYTFFHPGLRSQAAAEANGSGDAAPEVGSAGPEPTPAPTPAPPAAEPIPPEPAAAGAVAPEGSGAALAEGPATGKPDDSQVGTAPIGGFAGEPGSMRR